MAVSELHYFNPGEFIRGDRDWFPDMHPRLLTLLDVFRHQWGTPVAISPHPKALGRIMDSEVKSDHNFTRNGVVLAADIMPSNMTDRVSAQRALDVASRCAFTAIGLYPHWRPGPGLHLGVRPGDPANPARWGALRIDQKQVYRGLREALDAMS